MSQDHEVSRDEELSVQDLIAELARIEDGQRMSRLARSGDGSAIETIEAVGSRYREQQIVGLLRGHPQVPHLTARLA